MSKLITQNDLEVTEKQMSMLKLFTVLSKDSNSVIAADTEGQNQVLITSLTSSSIQLLTA